MVVSCGQTWITCGAAVVKASPQNKTGTGILDAENWVSSWWRGKKTQRERNSLGLHLVAHKAETGLSSSVETEWHRHWWGETSQGQPVLWVISTAGAPLHTESMDRTSYHRPWNLGVEAHLCPSSGLWGGEWSLWGKRYAASVWLPTPGRQWLVWPTGSWVVLFESRQWQAWPTRKPNCIVWMQTIAGLAYQKAGLCCFRADNGCSNASGSWIVLF